MYKISKLIVRIKNRRSDEKIFGLPMTTTTEPWTREWKEKIAFVRYVRRLQRGPTDDRRCHARFAILEMVGPSNAAALPPRHQEKRRCARRIQSVRRAALAPANRPASQPALARASGRFYYQSHDITETVANQAADPLECGYYHNTNRVLCVSTRARARVCVCVCACRFTRFASSSLFFFSSHFSSAVSFFHYYFYYYYHRRLLLLYFFSSSS